MSENKSGFHLVPGTTLGRCKIERRIGRGPKTEVYRAYHEDYKREVAVKVFYPANVAETAACFRSDAETITSLKHPNIIRMYGYGIENNVYFIVMELIEGTSLRDVIPTGPTGINHEEMLRLFTQIASAVAYAHDQNIAHGNLKPDNVLLDITRRPILTDFAIPCLARADALMDTLRAVLPTYAAPEQAAGPCLTRSCDIYTLGILLYEMLTGTVPFKGETRESVMAQHLTIPPVPPSQINPALDLRIERVILKALSKNPADRYPSARDMLIDLQQDSSAGQYETLALERDKADEVRKRQSEIMRFRLSRMEQPEKEAQPADPAHGSALALWLAGAIFVGILIIGLVALLS